jgi:hypothetical protein
VGIGGEMGSLSERLRANRQAFLIAGIIVQSHKEDFTMERKDLESKTIEELTVIYNKLVAKNEQRASFRSKAAAIEAVSKAGAGPSPKGKVNAKAAEAAAGEIKKAAAKPDDNARYKVTPGQHRLNEGSTRKQVFDALGENQGSKGITIAELQKTLPRVKNLKAFVIKLLEVKKVAVAA